MSKFVPFLIVKTFLVVHIEVWKDFLMQICIELWKKKKKLNTTQVTWYTPGSRTWKLNENNNKNSKTHFPNSTSSADPKFFNFLAIWEPGWVFSAITETILFLTTTTVPNKPLGSGSIDSLYRLTTIFFLFVSAGRAAQTVKVHGTVIKSALIKFR